MVVDFNELNLLMSALPLKLQHPNFLIGLHCTSQQFVFHFGFTVNKTLRYFLFECYNVISPPCGCNKARCGIMILMNKAVGAQDVM